jgi:hypothetical protein
MQSPDATWTATYSFQYLQDGYRVQLLVASSDGAISWSPINYTGHGEGYSFPFIRYWSPDSRYFFFAERVAGGSCDFFPVEDHWVRLDVGNRQLNNYQLPEGRGHSISPDGFTVAYGSPRPPNQLVLLNLKDGTEVTANLPLAVTESAQVGHFLWDPGSTAVVFATSTSDFCGPERPSFSLLRYDTSANKLTSLVADSPNLLRPTYWHPAGAILVEDWNGLTWWIDDETGSKVPSPQN